MAESEVEKAAAEAYPESDWLGHLNLHVEARREGFAVGWEAHASRLSPPTREELARFFEEIFGERPPKGEGLADEFLARFPYLSAPEEEHAALAKAWDEGLSAGADRWMDAREFGDKPVNPYLPVPAPETGENR